MSADKELIYFAPIYDSSGYASCARAYIKAIYDTGCKIRIEPMKSWCPVKGALTEEEEEFFRTLEHTSVSRFCTKIQHMVPDCYHEDADFKIRKMNIGYTVFETSTIPPTWVPLMNKMTKIFVPCEFNLQTFQAGGFDAKKMVVIPHIVNTDKFDPTKYEPMPIPIQKEFYFLSVFDFTIRKGWDILLRAYLREFKGNHNVGLILKTYFNGTTDYHKQNLLKIIRDFKDSLNIHNAPDIIFIGDILQEQNLCRLYKAAHAFVLPTRGEGFGIPIAEAMAMELPVIVTNWSGHLEFCKPFNSYLINVLGFEPTSDEMLKITPNYKDQQWATPSESHLRELMRYVFEHYGEAKKKAQDGRIYLQNNFSSPVIGKKIMENII